MTPRVEGMSIKLNQRVFISMCRRRAAYATHNGFYLDWVVPAKLRLEATFRTADGRNVTIETAVARPNLQRVLDAANGVSDPPKPRQAKMVKCDDCGDTYGPNVKRCKCGCELFKVITP